MNKYLLKWITNEDNKYERWFATDVEMIQHINYLNRMYGSIKIEIYSIKNITDLFFTKIDLENQLKILNEKLKNG